MKRIYEVDPLVCLKCGSEMKVVAFIIDHVVVDKILRHFTRREEEGRGRGPPGRSEFAAVSCPRPKNESGGFLVELWPESGLKGFPGVVPREMPDVVDDGRP